MIIFLYFWTIFIWPILFWVILYAAYLGYWSLRLKYYHYYALELRVLNDNPFKTELVLLFTRRYKTLQFVNLIINGVRISIFDSAKYLELVLDRNLIETWRHKQEPVKIISALAGEWAQKVYTGYMKFLPNIICSLGSCLVVGAENEESRWQIPTFSSNGVNYDNCYI